MQNMKGSKIWKYLIANIMMQIENSTNNQHVEIIAKKQVYLAI